MSIWLAITLWIGTSVTLGTAWAGINHLRSLHHTPRNNSEGDGVGELGVGQHGSSNNGR